MVSELEKYYISKGFRSPKYSYINMFDEKGTKVYYAEVILPNGKTIRGELRQSFIEVCIFNFV